MTAGGTNGPSIPNGAPFAHRTRTRSQLRAEVLAKLGFTYRQTPPTSTKTVGQLVDEVIAETGFPSAIAQIETATLLALRTTIAQRLGFYVASGNYPTGFTALIDGLLAEAQATLHARIEMDGGVLPPLAAFTATTDVTTIDYVPVLALATGLAKAHYEKPDAKVYFDAADRWLADRARRRPPNIIQVVTNFVRMAQETIIRRYEMDVGVYNLSPASDANDVLEVDWHPVKLLATAHARSHYDRKDAKLYYDQVEKWFTDMQARMPANAVEVVNQALSDANEQAWWRYEITRRRKWFSIAMQEGERIYDWPRSGGYDVDLRRNFEAWVQRGGVAGNQWTRLVEGIPAGNFSNANSGPPQRFRVGEYFEVWPNPDSDDDVVWIDGQYGLTDFVTDDATPSCDFQVVKLLATLLAAPVLAPKMDARGIGRDLELAIGDMTAATHVGKRYIPRSRSDCPTPAEPIPPEYPA